MSLTDSEVRRIRYELGYNVLTVSAEPYVGVTQLFEQVIQQYVTAGASTTSTTTVEAATSLTPVTITLASATGFAAGVRVVIDVDSRQEVATVQSISGTSMVVQIAKAHSGTYPVSVECGESIVRGILRQIDKINGAGGAIESSVSTAGIKKVDEIEFQDTKKSGARSDEIEELLCFWRNELASALGVVNLREQSHGSGSTVALY